ncbi:LysR family transcriptional regulator [Ramlibacter sp. AN1015]|uniref:LysR family transcriptional regulator n=1 Tax=Ramlibacter sp. AN1015 TaxID=3133428 RepID=UPI0030C634E2
MRLRDLDLNLLVALDALLREVHVSRAAARLDMSQSSMSLALSKLRALFNDPLLVKGGNGLVLTAQARELAAPLSEALRNVEGLLHVQQDFDPAHARDTITLIVTDYIDFVLVPLLVELMSHKAPGVVLRVVGPNPKRLGEVFSAGEVDVSVSYFPNPPASLRVRPVFTDRLVGIARRGHPFFGQVSDLDAFCKHRHVTVEPGEATMYNALLDQRLASQGRSRRIVLSKPTFLGVPFIVEATDLLATLPERVARGFARFTKVDIFDPPLALEPLNVVLLWHERTHTNPLHRWFRQQVVELCAGPLDEAS